MTCVCSNKTGSIFYHLLTNWFQFAKVQPTIINAMCLLYYHEEWIFAHLFKKDEVHYALHF